MFKWLREKMPSAMDELGKLTEAQDSLSEQGIFPPAAPDRTQCAPTWHSVMDAVDQGVALAEAMGEAAGRSNEETRADAGFFGIIYGFTQFVKDGMSIQKCMDKQDEVREKEMAEYVEQVKEVAFAPKPEPVPVPHDPRRLDPNLTYDQVMGVRQQENTKRYTKGLPQIPLDSPIWDGYNWQTSCFNGNSGPFAGSEDGKSNIFGGGLMPDPSGATIDVGNGNGCDRGPSNNSGVEITICLKDGNGNFTDCYNDRDGHHTGPGL